MPDVPPERAIELLSAAFGDGWIVWDSGRGAPAAYVFAQAKANADGRGVLTGLVLVGDGITAESLRQVPVSVIEKVLGEKSGSEERMRADLAKLPPLERGDLSPSEFSQLVADHYKVWARRVPKPAAAMAQEWGVKSNTMHSWIRDARLRGLLPEAGRGKRARD
jgi:hypothetical protein